MHACMHNKAMDNNLLHVYILYKLLLDQPVFMPSLH